MPIGMKLKSEPYASDIAAPKPGYDVAGYCRAHGLDYVERVRPLTLERFLDYADWYTEQLVPDVRDVTVTEIKAVDGGFRVGFADADAGHRPAGRRRDRRAALRAYSRPSCRACRPTWSRTPADHHSLDRFQGRRVAVVGAGQSALETAALLHESGADVQVIVRRPVAQLGRSEPGDVSGSGDPAAGNQALRGMALRLLEHPRGLPPAAAGHADHKGAHRARALPAPGG